MLSNTTSLSVLLKLFGRKQLNRFTGSRNHKLRYEETKATHTFMIGFLMV